MAYLPQFKILFTCQSTRKSALGWGLRSDRAHYCEPQWPLNLANPNPDQSPWAMIMLRDPYTYKNQNGSKDTVGTNRRTRPITIHFPLSRSVTLHYRCHCIPWSAARYINGFGSPKSPVDGRYSWSNTLTGSVMQGSRYGGVLKTTAYWWCTSRLLTSGYASHTISPSGDCSKNRMFMSSVGTHKQTFQSHS